MIRTKDFLIRVNSIRINSYEKSVGQTRPDLRASLQTRSEFVDANTEII